MPSELGAGGYVLFWGLFLLAVGLFSRRIYQLWRYLFLGSGEGGFGHFAKRTLVAIGHVVGQWCQLKNLSLKDRSSLGHAFMVWGFLTYVLFYLIFIIIGIGFGLSETLEHNRFFIYYSWVMNFLAVLIIIAALWGIIRRYIIRPARLKGEQTFEAMVILVTVLIHPLTHLFKEATSIAAGHPPAELGGPVTSALSHLWDGAALSSINAAHTGFFWAHWGVVLFVLVYIAYSRYLHMVASPINVLLRASPPKGALRPIDLETAETFGVSKITDFTWKQLIDLYACVICGQCQDRCPAYASEKPLNPKALIQDLKKHLLTVGPGLVKGKAEADPLVEDVISEETVWSCTTCLACMEACPVANEQMYKIVDLRRNLVLEQAKMPDTAMGALRSIETRGHPWRGTTFTRTDWASGLEVKELSQDSDAEVLYWVGCTAALDDRCQKVAIAMARILTAAGVNFAILGNEESCCGDPARRMGNEYLFQLQAQRNIETLKQYNVKKIVTACPHCYNTLKNEYPQFGGDFEVMHHSQFIASLLREGRLKPSTEIGKTATYHDPCYLGRYNDLYEEPRKVLASLPMLGLREMERRKRESFCCGGGGGRSWMEEPGTKISHLRTDEAIGTKADILAVACPYCMIMFEDAVKAKEAEETLKVLDIAELVAQTI